MRRAAALLVALVSACAPTPPPADSAGAAPAPGDGVVVGRVAVVGSAPMNTQVVVQPDRGAAVQVEGALREEIRTLAGARVEVTGRMGRGTLAATRYRILSVNGEPVLFGTVERGRDGGLALRLEDGSTVTLQGATTAFRPGQKVWVQGPGSVRVQVFGIVKQ